MINPRYGMLGLIVLLTLTTGCAAFRPIKGVPARYVPDEFRGPSRSGQQTIDLSLLRQTPPPTHLVDTGDLLAIYIEGILGKTNEHPPVYFPVTQDVVPTIGFPLPVREDGTISLPLVGSVSVRGLTLVDVEERIRRAYTADRQILVPGRDRIFVALQRPRTHRVLVIRQEASNEVTIGQVGTLNLGTLKRGTGKVVNLPAYKNDVLNALAETGGLPGTDAENAIYVIRAPHRSRGVPTVDHSALPKELAARQTTGVVIRGQDPGWGSPNRAVNPLGNYRQSGSPGFSVPPATPALPAPIPDPSMGPIPAQPHLAQPYQAPAGQFSPYQQPQPYQVQPSQPNVPLAPTNPQAHQPVPVPMLPPQPVPNVQSPQWRQGAAAPGTPAQLQPYPLQSQPMTTAPEVPPAPQWGPGGQLQGQPYTTAPQTANPAWNPAYQGMSPQTMSADPYSSGLQSTMAPPVFGQESAAWAAGMGGIEIGDSLDGRHIIRIPIRLGPGERTDITESDIILEDGDIVFIESRDTEVFYTGGLLGGGQYTLPRDYDLDVLAAIAIAQGRQNGGGGGSRATQSIGGQSALNGDVSISASRIVVLRPLPDGSQIPVSINLYDALRNPSERIIIQPGDYILLQYTKAEAVGAFIERHLLEGALFSVASSRLNTTR